jgi:propane 2-monooxygenase large subunit
VAHAGRRQFWARYHGWDLADVIEDLGYVRPDGKTLIGQPALDLIILGKQGRRMRRRA